MNLAHSFLAEGQAQSKIALATGQAEVKVQVAKVDVMRHAWVLFFASACGQRRCMIILECFCHAFTCD